MPNRMLKFTTTGRALPGKRAADVRREDFSEVYTRYSVEAAAEQASRCSQCGIPYCQIGCPLQNNIPDWLKLAAEDRLEEAYLVSSATNNMPEICGRICPQDKLCEASCVIEKDFEAVTIGAVEQHITDTAWEKGWVEPLRVARQRDQSVGIVGAGPAGLSAAEELRKRGYSVAIYDRYDRAGGMLMYGIPDFKLAKQLVRQRVERLEEGGIAFHLNVEIGSDITFAELRQRHDAILLATGTYKARTAGLPGAALAGVEPAMAYLTAANRVALGDDVAEFNDGRLNAAGKKVVVLGGGDTAMDCVRTAVRQGAVSVKCLYRRDRENIPGSRFEVVNAEEEGVEFVWLASPKAFLGDGRLVGVRAQGMRLGSPDVSGRRVPQPVPDSTFSMDADLAIEALGFEAEALPELFATPDLLVGSGGIVETDPDTLMTGLDGVFAAGDIMRGASLVVWAIHDGRKAAGRIHRFLLNKAGLAKPTSAEAFLKTFEQEYAV